MEHSDKFLRVVEDAKSRIREISIVEVKSKMDAGAAFVLVDVREDAEWAAGRLPGALHLGKGILERDVEKAIPAVATEIVLYCGGGFRSALAADNLQKMGYTKVTSMTGGFRDWRESGFPLEG